MPAEAIWLSPTYATMVTGGPARTSTEPGKVSLPVIVAHTCLDWATVELIAPVVTPLVSVTVLGWVIVLPVPDAVRVTGTPTTGLLLVSSAVTVTVAVISPALATMLIGDTVTRLLVTAMTGATADAENVTVPSAAAVAVSVLAPGVDPSTQLPMAAIPA